MASKKKNSAAVFVLFAAAVIFFITIAVFTFFVPDGDTYGHGPADYGMQFNRMSVSVEWDDDRSCKLTQNLEVEFFENSHGIYIDIPVNSGEKVRNLNIETTPYVPYSLEHESGSKLVRAIVGNPDRYFGPHASQGNILRCEVTYDYITPKHDRGDDILALMAIGNGWTSPVVRADVTVTFPAAPDSSANDMNYGIYVADKAADSGDKITWSNDGKTVRIDVGQTSTPHGEFALLPYTGVEIAYKMPDGTLKGRFDTEAIATVAVGAVLLIAVVLLMVFMGKDKPLTPIVDFYPPRIDDKNGNKRHMLPVQMGKIIDGTCSASDVTSLVFYWASEGYLAIDERADGTYLRKLKDVREVETYERKLFDKIFAYGVENADGETEVSVEKLSGKIGKTVTETCGAVNAQYSGKLFKRGYTLLSVGISAVCALFGALTAILTSLRIGSGFFNLFGASVVIPVGITAVCGSIICRYYFKLTEKKRRALIGVYFIVAVLAAVATSFTVPADVMGIFERIVFALTLGVSSALAPFLTVRTEFYDEQLNSILGFRNFLRDAEKERLELLLADDPQYYYNILPYANVLGVSDIWEEKFKELTLEPPTYYRGTGMTVFNYMVIRNLTRSIGSSLTYVPSSNSGSFSRGGGGHSGGGFSGGSFGGGGGGRW